MPQGSSGFVNPTFLNCKCNTVSASTPARNPYFNNPIRYSENGLHGVPCIDNQTLTLSQARSVLGAPRKRVSDHTGCLGGPCPGGPGPDCPGPGDPCLSSPGTSACSQANTGIVPQGERNLGSLIYFPGSVVKKGAMAGTIAALDHVAILSSTLCNECPGDAETQDGDLRQFNALKGTWDRVTIQFQTEADDTAILGNGIDEPFHLDLEYIAANLVTVLGELRLNQYGWTQIIEPPN